MAQDMTQKPNHRHDRRHRWTLTHGFYAAMGGFVLETSEPILRSETRFVLTPAGVQFLMRHAPRVIPDLSEDSLLDRSKADGIQKFLFVWQMLFFCFSCAERLAQGLPLSLLEVSTLAHALCMLIICIVWWKKPFNVDEPTLISGSEATDVAALLLLRTPRRSGFARDFKEWDFLHVEIIPEPDGNDSDSQRGTPDVNRGAAHPPTDSQRPDRPSVRVPQDVGQDVPKSPVSRSVDFQ